MRPLAEYAVYKGDHFIALGTARECADHIGVDVKTFYWYCSPAYHRRLEKRGYDATSSIVVVKIEGEVN